MQQWRATKISVIVGSIFLIEFKKTEKRNCWSSLSSFASDFEDRGYCELHPGHDDSQQVVDEAKLERWSLMGPVLRSPATQHKDTAG